jgi:hypothetical protein
MPDLLILPCDCGEHIELARAARAAGLSASVALGPENPARFPLRVYCECDGTVVLEDARGTRTLSNNDWLDAVL